MEQEDSPEKLEQRLEQTPAKPGISKDILSQYVGQEVILELGHIGTNISYGFVREYDGKFMELGLFKLLKPTLGEAITSNLNIDNLQLQSSIRYSLPSHTINVNQIASITSLNDVINARKENLK